MDLLTISIEAAFGLVFLAAVREWWRRRDALSLDVVLVFGTLIALFIVSAVTQLVGPVPRVVTAGAIVALLAQPGLTLRLAAHVRPIPRAVLVAAIIGWAVTALPLAVLGSDAPRPLVLGAVAVFGITDVTAAAYLAAAARARGGAAATRLWVAAAATALFGVALRRLRRIRVADPKRHRPARRHQLHRCLRPTAAAAPGPPGPDRVCRPA
jgi:hypothetical protein